MRMLRTCLVFGASMLAWTAMAAPPTASDSLRLVDLTGEFDKVAANTASMDDQAKIAAFEKAMTPLAQGFYARSRKPDRYEAKVLKSLQAYPAKRDKILAVSKQFSALLAPARASFEKAFGPVHSEQPVYLLHSLGEMDGGTRDLEGKDTLVFGADGIVNYHDGQNLTPLFHQSCSTCRTKSRSASASRSGARCGKKASRPMSPLRSIPTLAIPR